MKTYLPCFLFGHRFLGISPSKDEKDWVNLISSDYCVKCGRDKKEIFVDRLPSWKKEIK